MLEQEMFKFGDKILIGVSGGADSMALLLAFLHFRFSYRFHLLVAHVNHGLREDESDEDQRFVEEYCFGHNVAVVSRKVFVTQGEGFEARARKIRFEFFNRLFDQYKLHKIALGHHRGDQAETVLMRLFRGSAVSGLKGIQPVNGRIVHPLLFFDRAEILGFLEDSAVTWREDSSNSDVRYRRNLVRHQLIPWLESNVNPSVVRQLSDTAAVFLSIEEVLLEKVQMVMRKHAVVISDIDCRLPVHVVLLQKPALRFYLFREIVRRLSGIEQDFYSGHMQEIEKLMSSSGSCSIDLPGGIVLRKEYDKLHFLRRDAIGEDGSGEEREIGSVRQNLVFADTRFIMKKMRQFDTEARQADQCLLDLDKVVFPLTFRHRKPGDRFMPLGMTGLKKLKEFFIDEKIPRFDRDKIVILCDKEKILWICGYRIDARAAADADSRNILQVAVEDKKTSRAKGPDKRR